MRAVESDQPLQAFFDSGQDGFQLIAEPVLHRGLAGAKRRIQHVLKAAVCLLLVGEARPSDGELEFLQDADTFRRREKSIQAEGPAEGRRAREILARQEGHRAATLPLKRARMQLAHSATEAPRHRAVNSPQLAPLPRPESTCAVAIGLPAMVTAGAVRRGCV